MLNVSIDPAKFGYMRAVQCHSAVIVMAKEGFPRIPCQYFQVKVIMDVMKTTPQGLDKMLHDATLRQLEHRWTDLRKAGMVLPPLSEHSIHIAPTSTKVVPL